MISTCISELSLTLNQNKPVFRALGDFLRQRRSSDDSGIDFKPVLAYFDDNNQNLNQFKPVWMTATYI